MRQRGRPTLSSLLVFKEAHFIKGPQEPLAIRQANTLVRMPQFVKANLFDFCCSSQLKIRNGRTVKRNGYRKQFVLVVLAVCRFVMLYLIDQLGWLWRFVKFYHIQTSFMDLAVCGNLQRINQLLWIWLCVSLYSIQTTYYGSGCG